MIIIKRCGMIEIPLKLQGKMNSSGLFKLNLISIIVKGDCLLDVNVQCAQGSYLPKSPGSPNCVEGGGDTPLCCIHLQVVTSPQSASLGDAVETSLPRTKRQMFIFSKFIVTEQTVRIALLEQKGETVGAGLLNVI